MLARLFGRRIRALSAPPRFAGPLRRDKQWFSIEDAVRRMSSAAAQRFQLHDCGLIPPRLADDLILFEDAITGNATCANSTAMPSGLSDVWVYGGMAVKDGAVTGQTPGRVR